MQKKFLLQGEICDDSKFVSSIQNASVIDTCSENFSHLIDNVFADDDDNDDNDNNNESNHKQGEDAYLSSYRKYSNEFVSENIQEEPILSSKSRRYTVLPIQYHDIWNIYKAQLGLNWASSEIEFEKDRVDWETKLNNNERLYLSHVLAFFASGDGIVNDNLSKNIMETITIKEAECAYGKQFEMENVHGETYSRMIEDIIKDPKIRNKIFRSIHTLPCNKKKTIWCNQWIESDYTFAHKLFAFAIVEGIFFSGAFASIFWFKARNVMPGLIFSNELINRDEFQHITLAYVIYSHLRNKLKPEVVNKMVTDAVDLETETYTSGLPCGMIGMDSKKMIQYIKYTADYLLVLFGYSKIYRKPNPFNFIEKIDVYSKKNFFEKKEHNYETNVSTTTSGSDVYGLTENF